MPELPDLEVFSKNLDKELKGQKLKKIQVTKGARINVSPQALKKTFENQKLTKVYREGKELRLLFGANKILGLHMMLHGRLVWFEEEKPKYSLVQFYFDRNKNLALTDFQRNARVIVNPVEADAPDAMDKRVNTAFLKKALQTRATIKNVLLDQHVVRGIGNAYADEILWHAGISPFSISKNIPADRISALAKAIRSVLKKAEKQISKKSPGIIGGEIRDFLVVHNAKKSASPGGGRINVKSVGGRKTYYTSEQKKY
jgi:formamidopyrimidine-DNA glycosylase